MKRLLVLAILLSVLLSAGSLAYKKVQPLEEASYVYKGWPLRYDSSVEEPSSFPVAEKTCLPDPAPKPGAVGLDIVICNTHSSIPSNGVTDVILSILVSFAIVFGAAKIYKLAAKRQKPSKR